MARVRLDNVSQRYIDAPHLAVDHIDLELASGEFLVLTGPGSSGKSSLLRVIAGLEEVETGSIRVDNVDITRMPPKQRDIAMVFENYALYPHMTVAENMAFPLRVVGTPKPERDARVAHISELLGLSPILDRKPQALDGGQRQHVAIGRALAQRPKVFLMDEPFNNLTPDRRLKTLQGIRKITTTYEITTIYATDNPHDLFGEDNRIALLNSGALEQVAVPEVLLSAPSSVFVASFFGVPPWSIVTAKRTDDGTVSFACVELKTLPLESSETEILIALNPRAVHTNETNGIPAKVLRHLSDEHFVECSISTETGVETLTASVSYEVHDDQECYLQLDDETVPCFSKATGKAIS